MNIYRILSAWLYGLILLTLLGSTGCTHSAAAGTETDRLPTATTPPPAPTSTPTPTPTNTPTSKPTATEIVTSSPTSSRTYTLTHTPTPSSAATSAPTPATHTPIRRPDDDTKRSILVDQDEQRMYILENDMTIRTMRVSTGAPVTNSFTPPWEGIVGDDWGGGLFYNDLHADYMWYLFPGPEGSILIHSVPYTTTGNNKVYDRLEALGIEPVSNGCVRISPKDAEWLKTWNPVGVPITITRWSKGIKPAELADQQ